MFRFAAIIVLGVPLVAQAAIPDTSSFEFGITSWNEMHGMPSSLVWSITQDADGYLWLGTDAGLVRFDGVRFLGWDAIGTDPLPDVQVLKVLSSRDGSLWLGSTAGVARINRGRVTIYDRTHGVGAVIHGLAEDRAGTVWAASRDGLFRFVSSRWEKMGASDGIPDSRTSDVYADGEGRIWVAARGGIFVRRDPGSGFSRVDADAGVALQRLSEDANGAMWRTDVERGFHHVGHPPARGGRAALGTGVAILHDSRGDLWVATAGQGVVRVRHPGERTQATERITTANGLASDAIHCVFEDRDGNIWIGTQGGLHRLSRKRVIALTNLGRVQAVEAGAAGSVWLGTDSELIEVREGARTAYGVSDGLPGPSVRALHLDSSGTLWAATNAGLVRMVDGTLSRVPSYGDPWPSSVFAMSRDPKGRLWIGDTELGLFIWDNGKLSSYRIHGRGGERPFMVFCDRRGYLWLGFADGTIGRIDQNDTFTSFARPGEGVGRPVTSIYQAADDSIWFVGTKGLTRFRDGTFAAVGKSNGLPAGPISGIVQDTDGYIWFGMTSGIARIDPNEPARAAASPSHRVRFRLYDIADGLAGMPRGFAAPGAVRAADGRLWFVTGSGVTVLDPASIGDAEVVPNPRIERVVVNDQQVYPAGRSPLPPGTTRIEIDYGVAQIASPLKVRFRYRLDGVDADWVDAGTRRIAFYTNLGPGNYRFTVISGTHDGAWRETGAEWMFAIQPAYYQTYWFYAACLALLLVSLSAMWQYRIRQIRRNFSLITAERMRLSRELHDTLLQSLVGVTLQLGVASHTLGVRPGSIGESLDRVRQNVERGIREARRRIVDLRWQGSEDVELPALLRGIKDRLGENGRKIEVVLHGKPGPTTLAVREQLTLIAQEAVHNALRHAEPQRIWITLQYDVDRVVLQISDDGRGFDPREVVSRDGSHYGLRIMEERAREIGGQLHVIASVSGGAEIKAVVPVRAGARPSASRKPGFGSIRSAWRGTFRRHQAAGSDGTRRVSAGR